MAQGGRARVRRDSMRPIAHGAEQRLADRDRPPAHRSQSAVRPAARPRRRRGRRCRRRGRPCWRSGGRGPSARPRAPAASLRMLERLDPAPIGGARAAAQHALPAQRLARPRSLLVVRASSLSSCPVRLASRLTAYSVHCYTVQSRRTPYTVQSEETDMKAIVQDTTARRTSSGQDIDRPAIGDGEVLVRVRAASIHVGRLVLMSGLPFMLRTATGLRRPKNAVRGTDIAGIVEAVGTDVTRSARRRGLRLVRRRLRRVRRRREDHWLLKPANLTFEQAAAVGVAGLAALQAPARPGPGPAGPEGPDQRRIGRRRHLRGADRQGVRRRGDRRVQHANVDLVRSIGADHVIDYTQGGLHPGGRATTSSSTTSATTRWPTPARADPDGDARSQRRRFDIAGWPAAAASSGRMLVSMFVRQTPTVLKSPNHADLVVLKELVEAGKVTPVIDRTYPLSETAARDRPRRPGHARGKVAHQRLTPTDRPIRTRHTLDHRPKEGDTSCPRQPSPDSSSAAASPSSPAPSWPSRPSGSPSPTTSSS